MINELINIFNRALGKYYYTEGEDLPAEISDKEIFIGGTLQENWVIVMKCPCGCGDKIYLNTIQSESPYWKVTNKHKGISIVPSIWRTKKCKSHFFVTSGKVRWS